MLPKKITYEDFEGNTVTETFYFNMTKSEMLELEASYKKGLVVTMEEFLRANDRDAIIQTFKKLILMSYGEKSEDGKRFIKNEELSTAFSQTPAYDVLFMELATDDKAGGEFMMNILPKEFHGDIKKEIARLETEQKAKEAKAANEQKSEPEAIDPPKEDVSPSP